MKCINFGKLDKKLLIPVVGGLIRLCYKYIVKSNPKYKILTQNPFLFNIYVNIGMILAFIPYLIIKCRSKKSSNISNEFINKSKLNIQLIVSEVSEYDIVDEKKICKNKIYFLFYYI